MKRSVLYLIICSIVLSFSSQVFAVAQTASSTALANTAKNVRDCSITKDPNVKYRCEVAAARAEAKAEEVKARKKQDMIATGIAGANALGAFLNMRKDNKENNSSASTNSSSNRSTATSTTATVRSTRTTATVPSTPTTPFTSSQTVVSSETASGKTTEVQRPRARPSRTTPGSEHVCISSSDGSEVTGSTLDSSCIGADIIVDLSSSCMCVQNNCFSMETRDIPLNLDIYRGAKLIPPPKPPATQEYKLSTQGGLRGFLKIHDLGSGAAPQTGLNLPTQAFEFLNQTIADAENSTSTLDMKFCSGASQNTRPAATASAQINNSNEAAGTAASSQSNTSSAAVTSEQRPTRSARRPAASQLAEKMNYAVKVRNQFAPRAENDSIN